MPCAPTCTETDVVTGLAQVSEQLHGLGVFLGLVIIVAAFFAGLFMVLAFRVYRRG